MDIGMRWIPVFLFLLTRLSRGVTRHVYRKELHCHISTHTPLARRDGGSVKSTNKRIYFYSHASREA